MQSNPLSNSVGTPGTTAGVIMAEVDMAVQTAVLPTETPTVSPTVSQKPSALRRSAPIYLRGVVLRRRRQATGSDALYGQERFAATQAMRLLISFSAVALVLVFVLYFLALR
jgi:hypothetical protein